MSATAKASTVDPITLEVVRNKLDGIANEMEMTLLRSSFSPIVKEGQDASASLFTASGETLAQATATPIHLATLIPICEVMLKTFPIDTMCEGDVYMMNDPYLGATHLPDFALFMPVFHAGRIIAFSATMTHHQDVGGMTPGSIPTNATEIYQEGIRIPPVRFRHRDTFDANLIAVLRRNVRVPDMFMGDLMAQVAACSIGARRVDELATTIGTGVIEPLFEELLDRSEIMTREALAAIPAGEYAYEDQMDNDGVDLDKRIRIAVRITVRDGTMHCDFSDSSPQVRGPFNAVPSGSRAAAYFAVRAITDITIPTNGGCFRPVSITVKEGSVLNPREPAPVGCRTATIKRVANTIFGALRPVVPDRLAADNAGEMLSLSFGGLREDGSPFVVGEMIAAGSGAYDSSDGVDVIETDTSNCMNMPIEALEMETQLRVHRLEVRPDSGGAGYFRGGLGLIKEFEVVDGSMVFTHRGERHYSQAQGAEGGRAGQSARSVLTRRDGTQEVIPSKSVLSVQAGDRVLLETAGGGGYGSPGQRPRDLVQADVDDGKVSAVAAQAEYVQG